MSDEHPNDRLPDRFAKLVSVEDAEAVTGQALPDLLATRAYDGPAAARASKDPNPGVRRVHASRRETRTRGTHRGTHSPRNARI